MSATTHLLKAAALAAANGCPTPEGVVAPVVPAHLSANAFADGERRYPIHSKSATWHAYAGALNDGASPEVVSRIEDAASAYQLDLAPLRDAMSTSKSASKKDEAKADEEEYSDKALPEDDEFPASTNDEIMASMRSVMEKKKELGSEKLFEASRNLVKNASYLGLDSGRIPSDIKRFGELRLSDPDTLNKEIGFRLDRTKDAALHEAYRTLENDVLRDDEVSGVALACRLEELDKKANLNHLWFGELAHPLEVVMSGPTEEEVNKSASVNVLLAGVPVPVDALARIPESVIEVEFRKTAALAVEAMVFGEGNSDILRSAEELLSNKEQKKLAGLAAKYASNSTAVWKAIEEANTPRLAGSAARKQEAQKVEQALIAKAEGEDPRAKTVLGDTDETEKPPLDGLLG